MTSVYLDNAATTPLGAEARAAMEPYLSERFGNASEPHGYGRAARARSRTPAAGWRRLLDAEPGQVVFTSGGSEADNQAVFGLAGGRARARGRERDRASGRARAGARARAARVRGGMGAGRRATGSSTPTSSSELLRPGDRLAAVMWANNVTGAVQPIERLAAAAAERRACRSTATRCRPRRRCRWACARPASRRWRSRRTSSAARRESAAWSTRTPAADAAAHVGRRPGARPSLRHREHRPAWSDSRRRSRPSAAPATAARRCATGSRPRSPVT